jgi:hypothetical protein
MMLALDAYLKDREQSSEASDTVKEQRDTNLSDATPDGGKLAGTV